MSDIKNKWWRGGAIYQIYPRSFYDSDANGIGDLKGITEKLDYVASLGVEGVWISPFFTSPMKDFGYDVSDFRDIDPIFGTMDDFDTLLEQAHALGLKIIIDLVFSHTSDQHEWFQLSCKGNDNPKSDWYVWADPNPDGSPPTNWQSIFGGPAWTFNTTREKYYLHNFLKEQPDLNYHNPAVQDEALNIAKFWLNKGVDGFRLDTVNFYFHDKQLRNNPPKEKGEYGGTQYDGLWPYGMQHHKYDKTQPENLDFIERLRALTDLYEDRFLIGEVGDDDQIQTAVDYTSGDNRLHSAYSFALLGGQHKKLLSSHISDPVKEELSKGGESWPSWAMSNHDVIRTATRWGENNPKNHANYSKMTMAILGCLRGSICIYQGEELGLTEAELKFEHLVDPWGIALWPEWQGRDGCRTPMPWNEFKHNAGFTEMEGTPWLPVCRKHYPLAVRQQELDEKSMLSFTKDFLVWRKNHPVLKYGDIEFLDYDDDILAFFRIDADQKYLCVFNLSDQEQTIDIGIQADTLYALDSSLSGESLSLSSFGFSIIG